MLRSYEDNGRSSMHASQTLYVLILWDQRPMTDDRKKRSLPTVVILAVWTLTLTVVIELFRSPLSSCGTLAAARTYIMWTLVTDCFQETHEDPSLQSLLPPISVVPAQRLHHFGQYHIFLTYFFTFLHLLASRPSTALVDLSVARRTKVTIITTTAYK